MYSSQTDNSDEACAAPRVPMLPQHPLLTTAAIVGPSLDMRYRVLAESMPEIVWATDAEGWHYYFNRRWYEYTGLSESESLGFGFASALHPEDRERVLLHWDRAWRAGANYELEYRFRRHDGVYHWFISRAVAITVEGRIVEWVGTCTDIDEQRRNSDRQRFLSSVSAVLAESLDYEQTLTYVAQLAVPDIADWCAVDICERDQEVRRLVLVHTDAEKVALAQTLAQRYPYDPQASGGVAKVLRTGQPQLIELISEDMLRGSLPDSELCEALLQLGLRSSMIVPLIARNHTLGAITLVAAESGRQFGPTDLVLAQELAHRAALAIDNARLFRQAQEAIQLRDEFLSIAAHELKTPLTTVMGYAELLQRRLSNTAGIGEREQRMLNVQVAQSRRLSRLIGAILDLSRLQRGRLMIEHELVDLGQLVQRLVNELRTTLEQHSLELELPGQPALVYGDAVRLDQIIQQLLQNAVKYSPEGGPIRVTLERQGAHIILHVADQGLGIPQEALPNLGTLFFRATNAARHHVGGLGIGLYLARQILALHGGSLEVKSYEGAGSIFSMHLPAAQQHS